MNFETFPKSAQWEMGIIMPKYNFALSNLAHRVALWPFKYFFQFQVKISLDSRHIQDKCEFWYNIFVVKKVHNHVKIQLWVIKLCTWGYIVPFIYYDFLVNNCTGFRNFQEKQGKGRMDRWTRWILYTQTYCVCRYISLNHIHKGVLKWI